MSTPDLIAKCKSILLNAENLHNAGFKDNARKELHELSKLLTTELREKKKT